MYCTVVERLTNLGWLRWIAFLLGFAGCLGLRAEHIENLRRLDAAVDRSRWGRNISYLSPLHPSPFNAECSGTVMMFHIISLMLSMDPGLLIDQIGPANEE